MKCSARPVVCVLLAAFTLAASTPCLSLVDGPGAGAGIARGDGATAPAARLEPACPCGCGDGPLPSALHALDPALRSAPAAQVADASHPLFAPGTGGASDAQASLPDPIPIPG